MAVVTLYTTWPSVETAEACARALVGQRLAACCTALPGAVSVYAWDGEARRDDEVVLLVKTATDRAEAARALILALHPYELPCVAAWAVLRPESHTPYLEWVERETRPTSEQ